MKKKKRSPIINFGKANKDMNEKEKMDVVEEVLAEELDETTATQEESADTAEASELLENALKQSEEYLALAQRLQADFDNFRRRNGAVRAEAFEDGKRDIIEKILSVVDNLERALGAAGEEESSLKSGVEMVLRGLNDILEKEDVMPIERLGEVFDPELENAILQGECEEGEPGTVCAVFSKGYKMGKRVIRHAMVKVVAG